MSIDLAITLAIIIAVFWVSVRTQADKEVLLECVKHNTPKECEISYDGEAP